MKNFVPTFLLALSLSLFSCSEPPSGTSGGTIPFNEARSEFETVLTKKEQETFPAEEPPPGELSLVSYGSDGRELAAYVSLDPGDGRRYPVVLWLTGGFGNSISGLAWEPQPRDNDQSGSAFRKAGILMMYPSLRGGNKNGGFKEGLYGEVDDVLAAIEHLKGLSYVDPDQVYLGGHSTGGTLALLVAAAAGDSVRAVLSLGPVADTTAYGAERLPFSITDEKEKLLRAPVAWLKDITAPTLICEGVEDGNLDSLEWMEKESTNPRISFLALEENDHFSPIAPATEAFARQILAQEKNEGPFSFQLDEVRDETSHLRLPPRRVFPEDQFYRDSILFEFAIYLEEETTEDDAYTTVETLLELFPDLTLSPAEEAPVEGFEILPVFVENVWEDYAPPSLDSLQYSSIGLEQEDGETLQEVKQAIRIYFRHARSDALAGLKQASEFMLALEDEHSGFLWDEATRQILSPEAWEVRRISKWTEEYPDIRFHITVHAYRNGDDIRSITLGLEKFGVPDVLFDRFPWSENRGVGNLINVVSQMLVEGFKPENLDSVPINLETIKNESFRTDQLEGVSENGIGKALLSFKQGPWEQGDPYNSIIELHPQYHDAPDMYAQQHALLTEIFGGADDVKNIQQNEELEAASERARAKLPVLREKFLEGYKPGEYLLLKAPFEHEEGNEWMWVQIKSWEEDGAITGVLRSDPFYVEDLKAGQLVDIREEDVFDFIFNLADGSTEGNETGEIIQKMSE